MTYLLIILVCPLLNVLGPVVLEPGSRWLLEVLPPPVLAKVFSDVSWNKIQLMRVSNPLCGNYGKLFSHFFDKTVVKATFLLEKLMKNWFHEILFRCEPISGFSKLWKLVLTRKTRWKRSEIHSHRRYFVKATLY